MKRPLAFVGCIYFMTNLIATYVPQTSFWMFAVFCVFAVFIIVFRREKTHLIVALITIVIALLARGAYTQFVIYSAQEHKGSHTITAQVQKVQGYYIPDTVGAVLRVTSCNGVRQEIPFSIQGWGLPTCKAGDVVTLKANLAQLTENEYLSKPYAYSQNIYMEIKEFSNFDVQKSSSWLSFFSEVRQRASDAFVHYMSEPYASIASAITTGNRDRLADDVKDLFAQSGLPHVLVVSGFHLSIVCGGLYWGLQLLFSRRNAAGIALVAVFCYALFVGLTPSVIRASIAMALLLIGVFLRRQNDAFTSLGAAALLFCLINPYAVGDVGLLLSVIATAAVLFVCQYATQIEERCISFIRFKPLAKFCARMLLAVAITIAVTISTLPVTVYIGGGVSLLACMNNIVATSLLPLILMSGIALCVFQWCAWEGFVVNGCVFVCHHATKALYDLAKWAANVNGSYVMMSEKVVLLPIFIVAVCVIFGAYWKVKPKVILKVSVLLLAVITLAYSIYDSEVVRVFEVGATRQNPSIVLLYQGKSVVLFRGGESVVNDIGELLQRYNKHEVDFWVDLRTTPSNATQWQEQLNAKTSTVAQEVEKHIDSNLFHGIFIVTQHQQKGNYAYVQIGETIFGTSYGHVNCHSVPKMDIFYGGKYMPEHLHTTYVWMPDKITWEKSFPEMPYEEIDHKIAFRKERSKWW